MSNYTGKVISDDYVPPTTSGISEPTKFAASLGRSASLGLSDYLAALGIKGTRAVTGGAPVTFQEALADVRGLTKQMKEESPLTYGAGQVAGALTGPGAAAVKLIKSAPKLGTITGMAGTGAVTGGVSGFTEDEDLKQAAVGAGLGALTGGVVGGVIQGTKRSVDKIARESAARSVEKLLTSKQAGNREALEKLFGRTDKEFRREENTTVFEEGKHLVDALREGSISARDIPGFVQAARQLEQKSMPQHLMNIGETALRGAGGAGVGGGLELLSGGFIPPGLAMAGIGLYGAKEAGSRMLVDLARTGASKLATQETLPLVYGIRGGISPTPSAIGAGTAATAGALMPNPLPAPAGYTGRVLPEEGFIPAAPIPAGDMLTPLAPPEATAPMPRLRQLAEEFRQRTGGQSCQQ